MTGRFAVIAGGGTAGHVHPGIAVAHALVRRGHPPAEILYVGSSRGIEQDLVPPAGFDLVTLPGKGIPRTFSLEAIRAMAALLHGVVSGLRLLGRERPRVVLSLGGFAAVPCALAAWIRRIPVVIHEQNAVPGAANRLIGRWARAAAVSFPKTPLPKVVLTGNPVRPAMAAIDRRTDRTIARERLGVDDQQKMVVVTGGSLGALRLNRAAIAAAATLHDRADITLYHVVGARDWEELASERDRIDGAIDYRAIRYENDMPLVFAAADLVVSRAGASTTAEVALVGLPSVLVPLPGAPGDHQTANASALVDVGGAIMVADESFDGAALVSVIDDVFSDPQTLELMSAAATTAGRPDAADRVAAILEDHAL